MSYWVYWILWGAMFFAIEGVALADKTPGTQTLTQHLVKWASLKDKSKGWIARRASLLAFFIWLVIHFAKRTDW